jgi:hypothetical protein
MVSMHIVRGVKSNMNEAERLLHFDARSSLEPRMGSFAVTGFGTAVYLALV